jgi:hypothetical protein
MLSVTLSRRIRFFGRVSGFPKLQCALVRYVAVTSNMCAFAHVFFVFKAKCDVVTLGILLVSAVDRRGRMNIGTGDAVSATFDSRYDRQLYRMETAQG